MLCDKKSVAFKRFLNWRNSAITHVVLSFLKHAQLAIAVNKIANSYYDSDTPYAMCLACRIANSSSLYEIPNV